MNIIKSVIRLKEEGRQHVHGWEIMTSVREEVVAVLE
jgi:hypothetical protein